MSCLVFVSSGYSTILKVDPLALVDVDYLLAEYCSDRCFHFLMPSRDDWNSDTIISSEVLDVYTDGS